MLVGFGVAPFAELAWLIAHASLVRGVCQNRGCAILTETVSVNWRLGNFADLIVAMFADLA
jgi:hypothetical protein